MFHRTLLLSVFLFTAPALSAERITSNAGGSATVAASAAPLFRRYVAALEARGAKILFMGGIRRGRCAPPRHKHPCGLALDVCQLRWGVVDRRCNLPSRSEMVAIATSLGLVEGGSWRSNDRGHVEIRTTPESLSARRRKHPAVRPEPESFFSPVVTW